MNKKILIVVLALALIWLVYYYLTKDKEENSTPVVAVNPPPKITNPVTVSNPTVSNPVTVAKPVTVSRPVNPLPVTWQFKDNLFLDGAVGFVGDLSHPFKAGDVVFVSQKPPFTNASYNGKAVVKRVLNNKTIVLDKAFGKNTPAEGGTITK